jgi:ribosome-associated translation inhibitor RaiA
VYEILTKEDDMRLEIRRRRLMVSEWLRTHIERQLRAALGRFARRVGQVRVYLRDVNGPRGGVDKQCRIVVDLPRAGRAVVSGAGTDPYAVVAHTAARTGRAVKRHLQRRAARRRRPGRVADRALLLADRPSAGRHVGGYLRTGRVLFRGV